MSDDGSYAQSPYDDYWDDELSIDLVDDLAEHTAYSPVWQDTPLGELEPYHSDWEYYSDDYYDDDPALIRKITSSDKNPLKLAPASKSTIRTRGRKRKLDEVKEDVPDIQSQSVLSTIRGTVWAQKGNESITIYKKGQQEKVALLTDWKNIFRDSTGRLQTFGKGQLRKDESWANDMGLADMGLQSERRHASDLARTASGFEEEATVASETDKEEDISVENKNSSAEADSEEYEEFDVEMDDTMGLVQASPLQASFHSDSGHLSRRKLQLEREDKSLPFGATHQSNSCLETPHEATSFSQLSPTPPLEESHGDLPDLLGDTDKSIHDHEKLLGKGFHNTEWQASQPDPIHVTAPGAKRRKLTQYQD